MFEGASFLQLLIGTVRLRPYVFLFLVCYLVLAGRHLGWRRTLVYLVAGYCLAWASELSAIHTGFPYGLYFYIPATVNEELWLLGVPMMDSLSYVFLTYASYSLATLLLAGWRARLGTAHRTWGSGPVATVVLAAFLFMLLDVVIDPLALRGYRWFLGQIYGYPEYGSYFGIPLSNFGGWFLVGLIMITVLQGLDKRSPAVGRQQEGAQPWACAPFEGLLLYFGVLIFNVVLTWFIGEMLLGIIAVILFLLLSTLALAAGYALVSAARQPPGLDLKCGTSEGGQIVQDLS
ncbi:MAG: carotenoid biosynthesis protein [Desulfobacca sp.]